MVLLTIGQVAEQAGLASSAIRYYEQIGLIEPAARKGGQRRFAASVIRRLQLIHAAREAGLSLAAIRELFQPGRVSDHWKQIVQERLAELERSRELLLSLGNCTCREIQECERLVARRMRDTPS